MRILIDTNILIAREDHKQIDAEIIEFQRLVNVHSISVCVHPLSIEDIHRDKDEQRRKIILSKVKSYSLLNNYPDYRLDHDFNDLVGTPDKINTEIDNQILYALYKNAIDFLVTQDVKLRKKARQFQLEERVLSIQEINAHLHNIFKETEITVPREIIHVEFYSLNLKDPFFDDLRKDYPDFNEWFNTKSKDGKKAWVYKKLNGSLGAFCAWKEEDQAIDANPPLPEKRRLKISTLKVDYQGFKIGELFLKMAFQYAIEKGIDEIYLTHFIKENDRLMELIEDFGFQHASVKNGEFYYIKNLLPPDKNAYTLKPYYPSLRTGYDVGKFIVPIQPQYHKRLFPEFDILYSRNTDQQLLFQPEIKMATEGNTIKKAYLCHSNIKQIKMNDILIFYRSSDIMALTSIGVVDSVHRRKLNPEDILHLVSKRTVYTYEEIIEIAKRPTLVLIFRWHFYFKQPIFYSDLMRRNILIAAPQSITQIEHSKFEDIIKLGGLNERYLFN